MNYSLNSLYKSAGITRQAVNKYEKQMLLREEKLARLIEETDIIRSGHPGCGVEKLRNTLKPDFMGRDKRRTTIHTS